MDSIIDCVLRNTLIARNDLFGEDSIFVAFETDDDHFSWSGGLQSSAIFGRIVYRRSSNEEKTLHSDRLVLKVTPPSAFMKDFSSLAFFNEIFFYSRILPFFETFDPDVTRMFPKYYNSLLQYNASHDETVIVFENLQAGHYLPAKKNSFLDYDHLSLMMRKLGEFHAYSYRARAEAPDKFHATTLCMVETNGTVLRQFLSLSFALTRSVQPLLTDPRYDTKLINLVARCDEMLRNTLTDGDANNSTHVLCHGDFLRNNVLFKYENGRPVDLKMVDLATWRFASPVIDLASVLYLNADQKMRQENWDSLIDEYYTAVENTFPSIDVPSKNSILAEFRTRATLGYFIASYFLPRLMVLDNDKLPGLGDVLPAYKDSQFADIPGELRIELVTKQGGEEATMALTDIIKDIIDRGFL